MLRFLSEQIITCTLKYIFLCQLAVNLIKTFYVKDNILYQQHLSHVVVQSTTKSENIQWLLVVKWTPCTDQIKDIDFIMQYLQVFFLSFSFMTMCSLFYLLSLFIYFLYF